MRRRVGLVAVLAVVGLLLGLDGPSSLTLLAARPAEVPAALPAAVRPAAPAAPGVTRPLRGRVVVIDPGHQLGNRNFPRQVNRAVPAGGFTKPCNTTGTATDGGYAEATFAWRVAGRLRARLEVLGARVVLTRHSNRQDRWGPCVDRRGRAGNRIGADLKISLHGDGSYARGARGFHVIGPTDRPGWTRDIHRPSRVLALGIRRALVRDGFPLASYTAGGDGLDTRGDLATLNLANIPSVVVELGNMRDRRDARRMVSAAGQTAYASALVHGVRGFLER